MGTRSQLRIEFFFFIKYSPILLTFHGLLHFQLRMFEQEIRNRDSIQPGTDVLMNALAAMQDKNCTLEKNLSAETRVKLDLFSALGDAKRQLEISESK